jgi:phosphoribosylformylglycinamidine synthase PurS subunit
MPVEVVQGPWPAHPLPFPAPNVNPSLMPNLKARIVVTLRNGVLDPQGKAIEHALASMGVGGVASLRQGKVFDVEINAPDRDAARAHLTTACEKLLANTVIENYAIEL